MYSTTASTALKRKSFDFYKAKQELNASELSQIPNTFDLRSRNTQTVSNRPEILSAQQRTEESNFVCLFTIYDRDIQTDNT